MAHYKLFFTFTLFFSIASPVRVEAFKLAFPVDCTLGQDCIIQNYVDLDPGEGRQDYNCGTLTYDGHKGTDFRIRDYQAMNRGVAVYAAAFGRVLGSRNNMADRLPDQSYEDYVKSNAGKECGNGVVLLHDNDYQTQYCHMKKGSVTVKKGDIVDAGDLLGYIGMSGKTQFPHLHISVRKDNKVIGPFTGKCSDAQDYLWKDRIEYTGTHLLKFGFTDTPPTMNSIEKGETTPLTADSPALLFWVNVVGIKEGDQQEITITGPDGKLLIRNAQIIKKSKVNWLSYVGKKRPSGGWQKGTYKATYTVKHDSEAIVEQDTSVTIH